jgi:predicted transcriptional regulator
MVERDKDEVAAAALAFLYQGRKSIVKMGDPTYLFNSDEIIKRLDVDPSVVADALQSLEARKLVGLDMSCGVKGVRHVYLTNTGYLKAEEIDEKDPKSLTEWAKNLGWVSAFFLKGVVEFLKLAR